jgi:hypothetical protein
MNSNSVLSPRRIARLLGLVVALAGLAYLAKFGYMVVRYKAYIWISGYAASAFRAEERVPDSSKHLLFLMVDHYEPGKGADAGTRSNRWVEKFRKIADGHRDASGRRFRYTWFYPFDEHQADVVAGLAQAAREGYGEVELHWHHPPTISARFPGMLQEALAWFRPYGVMGPSGPDGRSRFGFIHGLWALDGSQARCGVNRELDILFQAGCYADFTFSTAGTISQPRKINSIYYATDTDEPKSYDDGDDVRVGRRVDDRLMIFEGPISIDWTRLRLEYASVENYTVPTPARISRWIDTNIHVKGRPEWVFVKVYSHGIQSEDVILDRYLDPMLSDLSRICRDRGITLHYVTAREAYNIVKAAEDGKTGDPEAFLDYRVPAPATATALEEPAPKSDAPR